MAGTLIVLNPGAGGVKKNPEILERLADLGDVRLTAGPGQARELAREAVGRGAERIVAAGGDGTISEVVNGMSGDFSRARLGIVPLGTANDLVRSLGIPDEPGAALEFLDGAPSRRIDVATVDAGERRHFVNVTVCLFGRRVENEAKERLGEMAYFQKALDTFQAGEGRPSKIRLDDEETLELDAVAIAVANGRFVGGGLEVAPRAEVDDGLLDVMILTSASTPKMLAAFGQGLVGKVLESEAVLAKRARTVEIRSVPEMWFSADGEEVGDTNARFEILPGAIRVLCPAGSVSSS